MFLLHLTYLKKQMLQYYQLNAIIKDKITLI